MFKIKYSMTEGMLRKLPNRTAALMRPHSASNQAKRRYGSTSSFSSLTSPMLAGAGMHQRYSPVWERAEDPTLAEDFLPSDAQTQHKIFRNLLMFDAIAGPAVEYWRDMAFGNNILLSGISDDKVLKFYQDAIQACGITTQMPMLLSDYLAFGKFVFHMYMDESRGYWTETIPHDLDYVSIKVSPIPSMDPLIDLQPNQEHRDWATSPDPRVQQQRSLVDPVLVKLMAAGQPIPLAPENTMFLARRVHSTDYYGTSFLTRIMPFKIYEKALLDASIAGARRRAGPLWHITVWPDATDDEMGEVLDLFFAAEEDPIGAKVVTREGVLVTPVGGGAADFWKLSDEWGFLSEAKMRALGISEQFLAGEANYNSMEMVLSTFLEKIRSVRAYFTKKILIDKICRQLAQMHGFVHRSQAELQHRVRTGKKSRLMGASEPELLLPTIEWDKPLTPIADQEYLQILDSLEEKGFPIPIRMRAQIAGFDIDKALDSFKSDIDTRKTIYEQKLRIKKLEENFGMGGEGGGGGGLGDLGGGGDLGIPGLGAGGPELEGGAELGGGGMEMPDLGGEIGGGGGEEAGGGAPPAGGGGEAGPGGAGASLGSRFSITPPGGRPVFANAREQRIRNVIQELEALPLWDREGYAFGLSMRRAAKILDRIQHSDPDKNRRSELSKTLISTLQRNEGLDRHQAYMVQYAAIRLNLLPPAELPSEAFELVNRYYLDRMAQAGLSKSLTREITFLSRISEACGRKVNYDHRDIQISKAMFKSDRSTPDNLLLTGIADVSPGPNVKVK